MFCTLKSSGFHPLAVWLFSPNAIFMRDQIDSLREQRPLHTEQLLHGSLSTLPGAVPQTCSRDTTPGSAGATEASHPWVSSGAIHLQQLWIWVQSLSPMDSPWAMRPLRHVTEATLCQPYSAASLARCIALKLLPRTAFNSFKIAESLTLVTLWHHLLLRRCFVSCWLSTLAQAVSPLLPPCVVTPRIPELMLHGCSLLRCHLQDPDSPLPSGVFVTSTTLPLQHVPALSGQWESAVSPQQDFKIFLRSRGGILKLIPKCRGQKVQSQGSVHY